MLTKVVGYVKALAGRRRAARELDEELRFHLDMETQANIARGMRPHAARREAMVALGGIDQTREAVWDQRASWLDAAALDLRYALRSFRRTPGFTAVAIVTLALGIGVNTGLFTIVNAVLIRPLPFPDADRLVRIGGVGSTTDLSRFDRSVFASLAYFIAGDADMTGSAAAERVAACSVSPSFFRTLGVRLQAGRDFRPDEATDGFNQVAIISEGLWQRQYGRESSAVGKSIRLNGRTHEIVGIAPREVTFPGATDVWIPTGFGSGRFYLARRSGEPQGSMVGTVARLQPGVTQEVALAAAQAGQRAAEDELRQRNPGTRWGSSLVVLAPLHEVLVRNARASLLILLASVALVLLIAAVNVANMLISRAARRHHELAVRLSLGASRSRLIRQLVTESLLLTALGAGAGLLIAFSTLPVFQSLAPSSFPGLAGQSRLAMLDWRVVGALVGVVVTVGVGCGLAPLRQVAIALPAGGLRAKSLSPTAATQLLRGTLIFVQVTAGVALVAGATLMVRSLLALHAVDLGFDASDVVTCQISLPVPSEVTRQEAAARLQTQFNDLLQRLSAAPGIAAAATADQLPFDGAGPGGQFFQVDPPPSAPLPRRTAVTTEVSPDYFRAMGLALIRGRTFTNQETTEGRPVAIVDEGLAARYWPTQDAIGKRIKAPSEWLEVVGVVRTVKWVSPAEESEPQIYVPGPGQWFVMRSRLPAAAVVAAVRHVAQSIDRDAVVSGGRPMRSLVSAASESPRTRSLLLGLFSALAVALAAVGIYGVVTYLVAARTQEIGIRVAFGASSRQVIQMVVRQAAVPLALGVSAGTACALLAARVIRGQLFGIAATDPATLAFAAATTLTVGLVAAYVPARRAGSVNPVDALKNE